MFKNKVSFILVLRSMLIISFVLSTFSFSPLLLRDAMAAEIAPVTLIGEAIADSRADAFVIAPSGESFKVDSIPMPVLKESRIQTGDGVATWLGGRVPVDYSSYF